MALLGAAASAPAAEPTAEAFEFFEKQVRPVLTDRCYECHSGDTSESGLYLDSLAGMLRGGLRGPAIAPGKPEASLLVSAIRHGELLKMPPKTKLSTANIAAVVAWIKMGAPWPNTEPVTLPPSTLESDGPRYTEQQRNFWAFQVPRMPRLPSVRDAAWANSPLDRFILQRLEAHGLTPAPAAASRTLIRRTTFDLHGLPATPREVERFVQDDSPDALVRVVDRLLGSPRYGERWGRHWLDVARYADSNGLDENLACGNAFHYRDYVIAAFNRDKPYDQFVQEQIAGDLLPKTDDAALANARLVATGFLSLGPKMLAEDDPVKMQMDIIDEQVDTIGRAFIGLTLGCARCHDHKFDPISSADYYALAGIFKSTRTMDHHRVVARWHERPLTTPEAVQLHEAHQQKIDAQQAEIDALQSAAEKEGAQVSDEDKKRLEELKEALQSLETAKDQLPNAMAVIDGDVEDIRIHIRGNHLTQGAVISRGFPVILARGNESAIGPQQSGRLELARWMTDASHPLTARVMVNRIWQGHFGRGLVQTTDNFGQLGDRPTHPGLLDRLAVRFVEQGWSIKAVHRQIMHSATYRMSSRRAERAVQLDPDNQFYWRWKRRRLEAEAVRDSILALGGALDPAMGGSLLKIGNRNYVTGVANVDSVTYDSHRRSVYLPVIRSALFNVFQAFDFADPSMLSGQRQSTTVAPQALFMMNSKLVAEQTRAMAVRLLENGDLDDDQRIRQVYLQVLARLPSDLEISRDLDFIDSYQRALGGGSSSPPDAQVRGWQSFCRAIVATNEFIYVE